MEEFNYTPLLHTHFHVGCHFARLPLCCHLSHGNKNLTEYWREGSTSTAISPTSASDVVGQHKIGGINFGATPVHTDIQQIPLKVLSLLQKL
jgi:hypothetical protein